jgi:sortase A
MFSLAERIVGYGLFESFTPRSAGPPASLTESVV